MPAPCASLPRRRSRNGVPARPSAEICHTEIVRAARIRPLAVTLAIVLGATLGLTLWSATPPRAAKRPVRAAAKEPPAPVPAKASPAVRRLMRGMTLRDEVAQLIFISFHGAAPNSRTRE